MPIGGIEFFWLLSRPGSKFVKNNFTLYQDCVIEALDNYAKERGGWKKHVRKSAGEGYSMPVFLSYGEDINDGYADTKGPTAIIPDYFYAIRDFQFNPDFIVDSENKARKMMGVPNIGEGWVSETVLFYKIKEAFSNTEVIQHGRPIWLDRQHFDIWMPEKKVAVEYHGQQHFTPVEFFGGEKAFDEGVKRDEKKATLAKENGVNLIIVTEGYDIDEVIKQVKDNPFSAQNNLYT
jgi:hypothetical protein